MWGNMKAVNLALLLTESVQLHADRPALIADNQRITYRQLQSAVSAVARSLKNMELEKGDKVAIMRDGRLEQVDTPSAMSQHPANDYVRTFIDSADKTRVLSVRDIMLKPACLVRITDSVTHAIREMHGNGVSSVYVRGEGMRLRGILTIDEAIRAHRKGMEIADVLIQDIPTVLEDTMVSDVLPLAAEAKVPIAVVDANGSLRGIVTKASVLSSML